MIFLLWRLKTEWCGYIVKMRAEIRSKFLLWMIMWITSFILEWRGRFSWSFQPSDIRISIYYILKYYKKSLMDISHLTLFTYCPAFLVSFQWLTCTYYLILHRLPYCLFWPSARVVSLFFLDFEHSLIFFELFLIMEYSSFSFTLKISLNF